MIFPPAHRLLPQAGQGIPLQDSLLHSKAELMPAQKEQV